MVQKAGTIPAKTCEEMTTYRCAILYHNYYSMEGIEEIRSRIAALGQGSALLLCSVPDKFAGQPLLQQEHERYVMAANMGKDIGGKLILIRLLLALWPDIPFVGLLHDKRSYHKHSGHFEKENLFSILEPDKFRRIIRGFEADPQLGIACARGTVRNESLGNGQFATPNSPLLRKLAGQYALSTADPRFVAGTMFWIRTRALQDFFGNHSALDIRATLEQGNILDHEQATNTHCWERMLSWLATSGGYKLKEF